MQRMSTSPSSRTRRLRDVLGAAIVAIGVSVTLTATADARAASPPSAKAPLEARLREAKDSLDRLRPPDPESADPSSAGAKDRHEPGAIRWVNYWANAVVVPWRNWNNWNNWHNFNQWVNL
jgi:hypothetical protein